MKRGDCYLVKKPGGQDPRKQRVYVVVSRPALIKSQFPTVICAPVFSLHHGLDTQVSVGIEDGLKKDSSIHCDELVSLPKSMLTHYVGALSTSKLELLDRALAVALDIDPLSRFAQ